MLLMLFSRLTVAAILENTWPDSPSTTVPSDTLAWPPAPPPPPTPSPPAPTAPPTPSSADYFRTGVAQLKRGEIASDPAERLTRFQAAREHFQAAAVLAPNDYLAHALWCQTLQVLVRELPDSETRAAVAAEAHRLYAVTAKLPDADWRLHNEWGRFLSLAAERAVSPADRPRLLAEAATRFADALRQATTDTDRALVHIARAQHFAARARLATEPTEKLAALQNACEAAAAAHAASPVMLAAEDDQAWAEALLERWRLSNDRALLAEALTRYRQAVAKSPREVPIGIGLARVLCLAGEPGAALETLRTLRDLPGFESAREQLEREPDWAPLRERAEFRALFTGLASAP